MTDRYESRASTHADDCWSWGPGHYKCAIGKIGELVAELREMNTERLRLREELDSLQEGMRALLNDPQFLSRAAMDAEWRRRAGND